jgi:hypothetical protein
LLLGQSRGKLDFDSHNEIAPLRWLLALWHALVGESLCPGRLCRTAVGDLQLLSVDCLDVLLPACEGFFEVDFDVVD